MLVNKIIVYVTLTIIACAIFMCAYTFTFKTKKRKVFAPENDSSGSFAKQDRISGAGHDSGKDKQTGSQSTSEYSTSKKGQRQKNMKDRESLDLEKSETSSLLALSSPEDLFLPDAVSIASNTAAGSAVRAAFVSVLSGGVTLVLHNTKGVLSINMNLIGNELQWKTTKSSLATTPSKTSKLALESILFVETGKRTAILRGGAAIAVDEEVCFSLITADTTYDFEASSKVERDAFAQGFTMLLEEIKELDSAPF